MDSELNPKYGWSDLPWKKLEQAVFKLQKRIFKAEQRGDVKTVRNLQKLLLKSRSAKLLAVRRVSQDNQGKKTAGVDGVKSLSPGQRLALANDLTIGQTAQPLRRVWIPKPGSDEKRGLGIPVMRDRATQALAKLALEPQWETRFEANSYGFRPGRSAWDAIAAIFDAIRYKDKYTLDADIAKCFDKINHQALLAKLNTFPKLRRQIKAWLEAGIMEGLDLTPTEAGTPQGSVISPLLSNIALHGLETAVSTAFKKKQAPILIRYADDFVCLHKDREVIEQCQTIIKEWLREMGLELKPSKTGLTHTLERTPEGELGFNFLGFHIRQYQVSKYKSGKNGSKQLLGFKTIIKPSKEAVERHYHKMAEVIDRYGSGKQADLLSNLNPVIWGWVGYFSTVCSKKTFSKLDHLTYNKLRAWARRRHPKKSTGWIYNHYWRRIDDGPKKFTLVKGKLQLCWHAEKPIKRHTKVQGNRSPFDGDWLYWSTHLGHHPQVKESIAKLLKRQKGKCAKCGLYFKDGDEMEKDHIRPLSQGGSDSYTNQQLLHRQCHDGKTSLECQSSVCKDKRQIIEERNEKKIFTFRFEAERQGRSCRLGSAHRSPLSMARAMPVAGSLA